MLLSLVAQAQIVDDSTKQIYSAKTTRIIRELDIKNNQTSERHPDTTLYRLESFMMTDKTEHYYQDLGNNGTALFPIFYQLKNQIGKTTGFDVYDPYMYNPEDVNYYDTKSPFISVDVIFGGNNRSAVDFTFARSINQRWNFGFDIHKITSTKIIGYTSIDDRNSQSSIFSFYTYYKHEKMPYSAMLSVVNLNHNVGETGGILVGENPTKADLFLYRDASVQLDDAKANDSRMNYHFYHEYDWQKQLQFYHQLDVKSQGTAYNDNISSANYAFYGQPLINESQVSTESSFKEVVNEVGIKGDLANLFYRAYLKRRVYDFSYNYWDPIDKGGENYIGGYSRFTWKNKFNVEGNLEYLQTGEYQLIGRLNSDLLFGSYSSVRAKAPIFYERYFGNFHEWNNTLDRTFTNEIKGGVHLDFGVLEVKPQARILSLSNYIFMDETLNPQQSSALAVLTSFGGDFNLRFFTNKELGEAFHIENEVYLTTVSGDGASNLSVPPVFYNGKAFWRGAWFKKTMNVEVGFDLSAKSAYYAMGYAPSIQHFYLQDDFKTESYFTADAFLNVKVSNVKVFIKWMYFNQQNDNGYFITPYYPGEGKTIDFGVNWTFYD